MTWKAIDLQIMALCHITVLFVNRKRSDGAGPCCCRRHNSGKAEPGSNHAGAGKKGKGPGWATLGGWAMRQAGLRSWCRLQGLTLQHGWLGGLLATACLSHAAQLNTTGCWGGCCQQWWAHQRASTWALSSGPWVLTAAPLHLLRVGRVSGWDGFVHVPCSMCLG